MLKAAIGTFGLKVGSAALGFILNLLLTQTLGAQAYGSYMYALVWLNVLAVPATLGLDMLAVRQVAIYHSRGAWDKLLGLLQWGSQITLAASVLLAAGFALVIWLLVPDLSQQQVMWISLCALPILPLRNLRIGVMKGLGQVVRGSIPETVAQPLLLMVLTGIGYWGFRPLFSVYWVMGSYVLASLCTLGLGLKLLQQAEPRALAKLRPHFQLKPGMPRKWLRQTWPFLHLGMINFLSVKVTILVLGVFQDAKSVGIFGLAEQISTLIIFCSIAVNGALAPMVAKLYAQGEMEKLQRVVTKSARLAALAIVPTCLVMITFSGWILSLFGAEFVAGNTALQILCCGQLFNGIMGSVNLILNMTGHEKSTIAGLVVAVIVNTLLSFVLIPLASMNGAAIAATASLIVLNLLSALWVHQHTGLHTTVLGKLG